MTEKDEFEEALDEAGTLPDAEREEGFEPEDEKIS